MRRGLRVDPCPIRRQARIEGGRGARRDGETAAVGGLRDEPRQVVGAKLEQAVAVGRHEGIEVDERRDALRHPVGDARHDDATIGVPHQDDVLEVLPQDHVADVGDVGVEIDLHVGEVRPLAQSRQRRRVDLMSGAAQQPGHAPIRPATLEAPVHQQIRRHARGYPPCRPAPRPRGIKAQSASSRRTQPASPPARDPPVATPRHRRGRRPRPRPVAWQVNLRQGGWLHCRPRRGALTLAPAQV